MILHTLLLYNVGRRDLDISNMTSGKKGVIQNNKKEIVKTYSILDPPNPIEDKMGNIDTTKKKKIEMSLSIRKTPDNVLSLSLSS